MNTDKLNNFYDFLFKMPSKTKKEIFLVNSTVVEPLERLIEKPFLNQEIQFRKIKNESFDKNMVVVKQDGEVKTKTPLEKIEATVSMVNSDFYTTREIDIQDIEVPSFLYELTDEQFLLSGFPKSNKEKLLLIIVSRLIEKRAYNESNGTIRSSFQKLSRIDDEIGTNHIYEQLCNTGVDVHLYGVPDWTQNQEMNAIIHGGYQPIFKRVWFVVYSSPDNNSGIALIAVEEKENVWRALWTKDNEKVEKINTYIKENL